MIISIRASIIMLIFLFVSSHQAFSWPIPDTGQTKCYDNEKEIPCPQPGEDFYGQDGNYLINPPSYTKLDEKGNPLPDNASTWVMVKDNLTGLIWENKTDDGSIHDKDNCNELTLAGFSDWRLPSREELQSIVDYSKHSYSAFEGFNNDTMSSGYFSSTSDAYDTRFVWTIGFGYGYSIAFLKSSLESVRVAAWYEKCELF